MFLTEKMQYVLLAGKRDFMFLAGNHGIMCFTKNEENAIYIFGGKTRF